MNQYQASVGAGLASALSANTPIGTVTVTLLLVVHGKTKPKMKKTVQLVEVRLPRISTAAAPVVPSAVLVEVREVKPVIGGMLGVKVRRLMPTLSPLDRTLASRVELQVHPKVQPGVRLLQVLE